MDLLHHAKGDGEIIPAYISSCIIVWLGTWIMVQTLKKKPTKFQKNMT